MKSSLNLILRIVSIVLMFFLYSCAGARGQVRFDELAYPVSMSPALYDRKGTIVYLDRELEAVGRVDYTRTIWSTLYTGVTFNPEQELGGELNEQIQELGGDGIVNLTLSVRSCSLNYFIFFTWLPFWPGCTVVNVEGDAVRLIE